MVNKMLETSDNSNDEVERVLTDLTVVIEQEVRVFQSLLDTLLQQQASILKGDTVLVSRSSDDVERIMAETRVLEKTRRNKSRDLSRRFRTDDELTLTQLIPLVEEKYAERLDELKDILHELSSKIQTTNKHNQRLLEHSMKFVDHCIRMLVENKQAGVSYGPHGTVKAEQEPLFRGVM